MPRQKSESRTTLIDNALATFWRIGYHVASMGDLVRETGVSRGGIYSDFSGKQELFHACLDRYQEKYVTPRFGSVEGAGSGIKAIEEYLESIVSDFESSGGPSSGCLVVNTWAQLDSEDSVTRELLESHFQRLENGFRLAIKNDNKQNKNLNNKEIDALAEFVMIACQGLAIRYRTTTDTKPLRQFVRTLIQTLETRIYG